MSAARWRAIFGCSLILLAGIAQGLYWGHWWTFVTIPIVLLGGCIVSAEVKR